jgi:hypothetical protein
VAKGGGCFASNKKKKKEGKSNKLDKNPLVTLSKNVLW